MDAWDTEKAEDTVNLENDEECIAVMNRNLNLSLGYWTYRNRNSSRAVNFWRIIIHHSAYYGNCFLIWTYLQ